jgi:hypothetical protein
MGVNKAQKDFSDKLLGHQKLRDEVSWLQHGQVVEQCDSEEPILKYLLNMNKNTQARPGTSVGQPGVQLANKTQGQVTRNRPHVSKGP